MKRKVFILILTVNVKLVKTDKFIYSLTNHSLKILNLHQYRLGEKPSGSVISESKASYLFPKTSDRITKIQPIKWPGFLKVILFKYLIINQNIKEYLYE